MMQVKTKRFRSNDQSCNAASSENKCRKMACIVASLNFQPEVWVKMVILTWQDTKEDQASKNPACPESRASSSSTGSSVKFETHIGTDNISTPHLPPRHSSPCPAPQQASLSSPPMSGIVGVQMPPYSTRANSYRVQSPANLVVPDLRMSERAPLPYAGSFPGHLPSPVDQFYQGQMWAYCQRTALLQYMQTANLGLSLFGFTLDRRFLQSLQTIVCSVFVFAIGRAMAKD